MIIKMVNKFKLTVVNFARPKPDADLCIYVDLPLDKKTVQNPDWATGPTWGVGCWAFGPAGPLGHLAAGPVRILHSLPRWLDIGQVLFCVFMARDEVEVHKHAKKGSDVSKKVYGV